RPARRPLEGHRPMTGVVVRRMLQAPAEKVFAAFADPALVARWLRPSKDVGLTVLAFDFRLGGRYRFAYDVPDGRRLVVGGTYPATAPRWGIVFPGLTEPPDEPAGIAPDVTVTLMQRGGATELSIRHERLGRPDAQARHEEGWRGALDLLEIVLPKGAEN